MIDFFHNGTKAASMTKRISGVAKLKGAPNINPRPPRSISKIGTFYDEEDAVTSILLEVADTPVARKNGLMGRKDLPSICGMLFEGLSGGGYFWMKDCLIPLDIAFMTSDGFITDIHSMPVDKDGKKHYDYDDDVKMAVEVPMGFFKKWGIVNGFRLETRSLKGGKNGKSE